MYVFIMVMRGELETNGGDMESVTVTAEGGETGEIPLDPLK